MSKPIRISALPSLHLPHSSAERGADFKEVQGPKSMRSSDANYRAPGIELTNKYSVLEDSN